MNAANIEPYRGIKLERIPAGGDLWVAVGDADFLPQLVEKDDRTLRLANAAGNLAQGLAHQASLEADVGIAHFTLNFGPGHQGRHRIDHHHIYSRRSHQLIDDLQPHFAGVGLGDQQLVDVDPQGPGIDRVEGVLRIHKGRDPACLLHLR